MVAKGINMHPANKNFLWKKNTWMAFDQLCQILSQLVREAGDSRTLAIRPLLDEERALASPEHTSKNTTSPRCCP